CTHLSSNLLSLSIILLVLSFFFFFLMVRRPPRSTLFLHDALPIFVERKRPPGRRAIEALSLLPVALPGTVIGLGYILAFNVPPLARKSTRLNSSHVSISYAVFCLQKKQLTTPSIPSLLTVNTTRCD